jgi:hypothetical protein
MAKKYVLFWFDVEDCSVTQSDDAAKRLCEILSSHGVRGTMKIVGQKARVMRDRIRYDAMDALSRHAIGYHSNWHGGRPQPAEYMAPLDWLDGIAEFEQRERQGLDDIISLFGQVPVTYGQPGSNWSPQVFPVLRKWGIPTYVSAFGYVGLYSQPFYYGGIINTSHMCGKDRRGRDVSHRFVLGFDLGTPDAGEQYRKLFADSYNALEDGGLISIANHPCQLVLERWFSTDLKPRELTEAGYRHFDEFVSHVLSHDDVETVAAEQLPDLYPDHAADRAFSPDELLALARAVGDEIHFQEFAGIAVSAAELFGMFLRFVARFAEADLVPRGAVASYLDGPALPSQDTITGFSITADELASSVLATLRLLREFKRLPDRVAVGSRTISPGDYFLALADATAHIIEDETLPEAVAIRPAVNRLDQYVDGDAARNAWSSLMMLPGFEAPKLLEQACLQAWTLKPAILSPR